MDDWISIRELLAATAACDIHDIDRNDEYKIMRCLRESTTGMYEVRRMMTSKWLRSLKPTIPKQSAADMALKSTHLREEGNKLFQVKSEKRDILTACRFYTRAIFAAPVPSATNGGLEMNALALAHANRAAALAEFGYYREAYDDCECALEFGYPEHLRQKIVARQALCALHLGDAERLKQHLDTLDTKTLQASLTSHVQAMRVGLNELQSKAAESASGYAQEDRNEVPYHRETQKIVTAPGPKGRHMIATANIQKGELIFGERATSFVPVAGQRICQECANTQLIPFPCMGCAGAVVYCSRKCQALNAAKHAFECRGYKRQLFDNVGVFHLALRLMINGLSEVVPLLLNERRPEDIWAALKDGGKVAQSETVAYAATLRLLSILGSRCLDNIANFAVTAELLVLYLKRYTSFFRIFDEAAASADDWETIAAALMLRHSGQLLNNAHTTCTLQPAETTFINTTEFPLLCSDIWVGPLLIRRGYLHHFNVFGESMTANFPYLSMCNHACANTFQPRFSGRYMCTYALNNIAEGEEIFNCYVPNCNHWNRSKRNETLKEQYDFVCDCSKCEGPNADKDFEKFYRFRCDNPKCGREFVPDNRKVLDVENWWQEQPHERGPTKLLKCTACGARQHCKRFHTYNELFKNITDAEARTKIYKSFKELDKWLLGYNTLKMHFAHLLIQTTLRLHNFGLIVLKANEYANLVELMKTYLSANAERSGVKSIEYASSMTTLWDFIAMDKYQCTRGEMEAMLPAVEILSSEFQVIFKNYYKNYIEAKLV